MAGLAPPVFGGRSDEDSVTFLSKLEVWLRISKYNNDKKKIAATGLLLTDTARLWFDSLDQDLTYNELKQQFKVRFVDNKAEQWRETALMWELKQAENQGASEFITLVEAKGRRCGMSEDQIRICALNGLLPRLKSSVLNQEVRNLADLRKWASIGERAYAAGTTPHPDPALIDAVKRLEEKLDSLQLSVLNTDHQRGPRDPDRKTRSPPRSPAPTHHWRRVEDNHKWSPEPDDVAQGEEQDDDRRFSTRNLRSNISTDPCGAYRLRGRGLSNDFILCQGCGGEAHPKSQCPARGRVCRYCGFKNHFERACRSAKRSHIQLKQNCPPPEPRVGQSSKLRKLILYF